MGETQRSFWVAAQLMRHILVDNARAHYATKRGGDLTACHSATSPLLALSLLLIC
jgi:ECF sigma factor